jgi:hypothetical protein
VREINHLTFHQWLLYAIPDSQHPTSPIGFLFLKLPPPPCAVLLVLYGWTVCGWKVCGWKVCGWRIRGLKVCGCRWDAGFRSPLTSGHDIMGQLRSAILSYQIFLATFVADDFAASKFAPMPSPTRKAVIPCHCIGGSSAQYKWLLETHPLLALVRQVAASLIAGLWGTVLQCHTLVTSWEFIQIIQVTRSCERSEASLGFSGFANLLQAQHKLRRACMLVILCTFMSLSNE